MHLTPACYTRDAVAEGTSVPERPMGLFATLHEQHWSSALRRLTEEGKREEKEEDGIPALGAAAC